MSPEMKWPFLAGVNDVGGYGTADELTDAGFRLVRKPFQWEQVQKQPGGAYDWGALDKAVTKLRDFGYTILLDSHQSQWSKAFFTSAVGFPKFLYPEANPTDDRGGSSDAKAAFYRNEHCYGGHHCEDDPWTMYGDLLVACAKRYADEPAVIGLDLLNEPGFGGDADYPDGSALAGLYEYLAGRVLEHAPHWAMVCENGTWKNIEQGSEPFKTAGDWPKVDNLVCSVHYYPSPETKQQGETEAECAARWLEVLKGQRKIANSLGVPFYLGEFCNYGASRTKNDHWPQWPEHTEKLAAWLGERKVTWTYWAWQTGAGPTLTGPDGHLDQEQLDALAAAFPKEQEPDPCAASVFGLTVSESLPERSIPLDAVAVVKLLDEDGAPYLAVRSTETLSSWEALGMLRAAYRTQDDDLAASFEAGDPGED